MTRILIEEVIMFGLGRADALSSSNNKGARRMYVHSMALYRQLPHNSMAIEEKEKCVRLNLRKYS